MKTTLSFLFLFLSVAHSEDLLTMNQYLEQVRSENYGYNGAMQNRQGSKESAVQSDLLTSFRLEGRYQLQGDQKLSQNPALTYERLDSESYSLGLAKTTTFGLDMKLSYDINKLEYVNPDPAMPSGNPTSLSTPTLSLTQSLWRNGFGRLTQAQVEAATSQAEYEQQNSEALLDSLIQKAITAYWNLVFQREIVEIQKAALKQSQALFDYNSRRSRMNLADRADSLQSKATLESKKLDLQIALDNEGVRLREFNLYRNKPFDAQVGSLMPLDWTYISKIKLSERPGDRADVKASKAQAQMNSANHRIIAENARPLLNLFGSYSLNGRASSYGDAFSDTSSANRPTTVIGLNLSMPLNFDSLKKIESGARVQANAAEIVYQQKLLDQEAQWRDIHERVVATQRRVELSESIVKAQLEKLEYERRRLREGRTSTYQVLLFEQDYINARMNRVQNASELISLLSQVRLYDEIEEGGSK